MSLIFIISSCMLFISGSFSLHARADIYFAIWITESIFSPINLALCCSCRHFCYSVIRFLRHYILTHLRHYILTRFHLINKYMYIRIPREAQSNCCVELTFISYIFQTYVFSSLGRAPAIFMSWILFTGCKLGVFISSSTPSLHKER